MEPDVERDDTDQAEVRHRTRRRSKHDDRGASGIEYALLLAVVVLVIVVGMRTLGTAGRDRFNDTACELQGAEVGADC